MALLHGKTLVVTGGNSGIGEAIVKAAATEGANVVIDYVAHPEETDKIIAEIEALGGHAVGVVADMSKAADLHRMVQTAVDSFGRLDALVNNAGIETRQSILDTTEENYELCVARRPPPRQQARRIRDWRRVPDEHRRHRRVARADS